MPNALRAGAAPAAVLVASREPGWPQWRGPRRDGISDEKGLLRAWGEGGPRLLWTAGGMGRGWSSPIVTGGSIYITGDVDEDLWVFALDLDGKVRWKTTNGRSWRGSYPGARASCTFDGGRLYHMNAHGRAACFDARNGRELWAVNVLERFGGRNITWAISENLLLDGERVIVSPGGAKALMAALDRTTGQTLWTSPPLDSKRATDPSSRAALPQPRREAESTGYASPILFEMGGLRIIVNASSRHLYAVDAEDGRLLWTVPFPTRYEVLGITPVLAGDAVFMTAPDSGGGKLLRMRVEGRDVRIEHVWTCDMDTCHGGVLLVGERLWGSWYRHFNGWGAIDLRSGATLFRSRELAMGSAIFADGRLYCLSQEGVMALVVGDADEFRTAGRFVFQQKHRRDVWAHPVICDGRLYLRYHDTLYCYDIRSP